MRDRAAMFDLTSFCVFDVVGPGALECVQRVSMRQMDAKLGRVVYTPVLTPAAAFAPTSRSCAWPMTTSGSSPAARTGWPT